MLAWSHAGQSSRSSVGLRTRLWEACRARQCSSAREQHCTVEASPAGAANGDSAWRLISSAHRCVSCARQGTPQARPLSTEHHAHSEPAAPMDERHALELADKEIGMHLQRLLKSCVDHQQGGPCRIEVDGLDIALVQLLEERNHARPERHEGWAGGD